mmetsp:Transcript_20934/g.63010  ORF Transcript_20934/g.63010 Transcript_20934/m.63010 type:complete len:251 (-) Transcript_20934:951-1703(-)
MPSCSSVVPPPPAFWTINSSKPLPGRTSQPRPRLWRRGTWRPQAASLAAVLSCRCARGRCGWWRTRRRSRWSRWGRCCRAGRTRMTRTSPCAPPRWRGASCCCACPTALPSCCTWCRAQKGTDWKCWGRQQSHSRCAPRCTSRPPSPPPASRRTAPAGWPLMHTPSQIWRRLPLRRRHQWRETALKPWMWASLAPRTGRPQPSLPSPPPAPLQGQPQRQSQPMKGVMVPPMLPMAQLLLVPALQRLTDQS